MALPELVVMQQTFELLRQLDPQARRRVLKWVKAALDEADSAPAGHTDTGVVDEPVPAVADEASAVDRVEAPTPEAPSATPAAVRPGRRAAKTAAKPARGRAKAKTAAPAAEAPAEARTGRRGRPPAEEIMQVYQQVEGKLTELAKHYGKPYGTIQGWASSLREQGYPIGRSRKS